MSPLARAMREQELERMRRMTPTERFEESLRLGQAAIGNYAAAHGVTHEEARKRIDKAGQAGRRILRSMLEAGE